MTDRNYDAVDALATILRVRSLTAAAVARIFNCARPVAYDRIRALRERGIKLVEVEVREGQSGPKATAYSIGNGGRSRRRSQVKP